MKKSKNKKKRFHMSKLIIPFVILSIFSFTGLAIWLQFSGHMELSATLITCFYGFCCSELWMLSSIKKQKIKCGFSDNPNTPEDESLIDFESYNRGVEEMLSKMKEVIGSEENKEEAQ